MPSLAANALVSLSDTKDWVGIVSSDTSQDTKLTLLINSASQQIERYVDRKLIQQTQNDIVGGNGTTKLLLRQWPVTALTAIYFDSTSAFPSTTSQDITKYFIEREQICYSSVGVYPKGYNNVKVTYTAGYGTIGGTPGIPADLDLACKMAVEFYYGMVSSRRIGTRSKTKGTGSAAETTVYETDLPQIVKSMLDPYRREEFGFGAQSPQMG